MLQTSLIYSDIYSPFYMIINIYSIKFGVTEVAIRQVMPIYVVLVVQDVSVSKRLVKTNDFDVYEIVVTNEENL